MFASSRLRFVKKIVLNVHVRYTSQRDISAAQCKQIEVGEHNIHYERVGAGDHTVLLLPGALGCARTDFTPQLENMDKDKLTIIAWDPPGYGKSRPPNRTWPPHFLERDACVAAEFMQSLNIDRYSLLGWSDGGITAMILASRRPAAVRKLVVWGANAYITKEDTEMYESIRDIDKWSPRMREPFITEYGEDYFRSQWSLWVDAFNRYLIDRDGDICKNDLEKIKCPTLVVHGQKDAMVGQVHADYLHKHITGSRLHNMADGKHNLHFKYQKEFHELVENFLLTEPAS